MTNSSSPLVGIIMGSKSDWVPCMQFAAQTLRDFDIPFECRVLSAHRTPEQAAEYARTAAQRGLQVLIAGAGGAAHLPGVVASYTLLPVIGVPILGQALTGMDSLLSMVQMPAGVPVATMAIGKAGAINAALFAITILGNSRPALREKLGQYRQKRAEQILAERVEIGE